MHPEPLSPDDTEWGRTCDHDQCRSLAEYHCACLCGRVLCETHELEERRTRQVRQGRALIAHRQDRDIVRAAREARRMEILRG